VSISLRRKWEENLIVAYQPPLSLEHVFGSSLSMTVREL
jgi:hypothetical protein